MHSLGIDYNVFFRLNPKGSRPGVAGSALSGLSSKANTEECVIVNLTETPTEIVFGLSSFIVSNETKEAAVTEERNSKYAASVESHKNKDGFKARAAQTINLFQKNASEMAAPNATAEMGCNVTSYEIHDAVAALNAAAAESAGAGVGFISSGTQMSESEASAEQSLFVHQLIQDTITVAAVTPGCMLDTTLIHKPLGPAERRGGAASKKTKEERDRKKSFMVSAQDNSGTSNALTGLQGGSGHSRDIAAGGGDKEGGSESKDAAGKEESKASGGTPSQSDIGGTSQADDHDILKGRQKRDEPLLDSAAVLREKRADEILGSKSMLKKLHMLERAVQQNAYRDFMLMYRDAPKVDPMSLSAPVAANQIDDPNMLFGGGIGSRLGNLLSINSGLPGSAGSAGGEEDGTHAIAEGAEGAGADEDEAKAANVQKLFTYFSSELSQGRSVSSMAWSAINPDLLAVGYGKYVCDTSFSDAMKASAAAIAAGNVAAASGNALAALADSAYPVPPPSSAAAEVQPPVDVAALATPAESEENSGGLVLFWSLRNPDHPEKVLKTPFPVTALDFSTISPAILAVGMFNGDVAIYDVRREHDWGKPLESAEGISGGHSDPVWLVHLQFDVWNYYHCNVLYFCRHLKWLVKGQDRTETLVSISTDGNVLEWSFKKGILVQLLMQLKRAGVVRIKAFILMRSIS